MYPPFPRFSLLNRLAIVWIVLPAAHVLHAQGIADDCRAAPDLDCVLQAANAELATIDDDRAWIAAVTELGLAASAYDDRSRAMALLKKIPARLDQLSPAERADAEYGRIASALPYAEGSITYELYQPDE